MLLLANVFESFCNKCIEICELDPVHFLSALGLGCQPCSQKTKVELKLLTDIDMLLMVQKEIRSGICHAIHRYGKQTIITQKITISIIIYHVLGFQKSIKLEYISKNI